MLNYLQDARERRKQGDTPCISQGFAVLSHLRPHWPVISAMLLALGVRLLAGPRLIDDAYITFRYARNLLDGLGFVYNAGQRVQGTTTPLYTLLMAGLAGVLGTRNFPTLAWVVNALADALAVAVLYRLGRELSGQRGLALTLGVLWALSPMSVTFSIGGMETSLYILLLLLALDSYVRRRTMQSALWCGLALLTRPDAALVVIPLFAHMAWSKVKVRKLGSWRAGKLEGWKNVVPWHEIVLLAGVLAPWTIFATLYFGSPLAHSIVAKSAAYRVSPYSAFVRLWQHYSTPFFEHLVFGTRWWPAVGLILHTTLYVAGGQQMVRRNSRAWPLVLFPPLYFAAFSLANPLIFRWYLAPPLPMYFLGILVGGWELVRIVNCELRIGDWGQRGIGVGLVLVLVALELNAYTLHPDHGLERPAPQMAWYKLELLYREVAQALDGEVTPQTTLAAGDIGVLGYYTGARILDCVGLVSPEALAYYPADESIYVINYAIAPDLILDHRPEWVVTLEVYARRGLLRSPRFLAEYRLWRSWPTDIYGSKAMLVFRRR